MRDYAGKMFVDDNENILIGDSFSNLMNANTTGIRPGKNVAVGYGALDNISPNNTIKDSDENLLQNLSQKNVAIGYNALNQMNYGYNNIAIGYNAGEKITAYHENAQTKGYRFCLKDGRATRGEGSELSCRQLTITFVNNYPAKLLSGFNNTLIGSNAGNNIKRKPGAILQSDQCNNSTLLCPFMENNDGAIIDNIRWSMLDTSKQYLLLQNYIAKYGDFSSHGNVAIGYNALGQVGYNNNSGRNNTFIGAYAGQSSSYGNNRQKGNDFSHNNIAIGYMAMGHPYVAEADASGKIFPAPALTGHDNIAIGAHALENLTTGSYNVAIGYGACSEVTAGSYKTCIGYNSGPKNGTDGIFYPKNENGDKFYPDTNKAYNSATNKYNYDTSKIDYAYYDARIDDVERTYIGSKPKTDKGEVTFGGDAVLEIHNPKSWTYGILQVAHGASLSNTTTIINGNLIVTGRPYFTVGNVLYHFHVYGISSGDNNNNNKVYYYGYRTDGNNSDIKDYANSAFGMALSFGDDGNVPYFFNESSSVPNFNGISADTGHPDHAKPDTSNYSNYETNISKNDKKFPNLFCPKPKCSSGSPSDRR